MSDRELVKQRQEQGRKLFAPARALAMRKGRTHLKKHGSVKIYRDSVIEVHYDTYAPNLSVYVEGKSVLYFHLGHIQRFIPNAWVEHLLQLAAPIMEQEERERQEKEAKREAEYLAQWGL